MAPVYLWIMAFQLWEGSQVGRREKVFISPCPPVTHCLDCPKCMDLRSHDCILVFPLIFIPSHRTCTSQEDTESNPGISERGICSITSITRYTVVHNAKC
ncbi:hypothetical protein CROQUDRAFT_549298 [Cronartium quercuum f. sp. fusiforme G11]|uniref:Uncharacterized protein n=1 Tax=Cronartium quercuum f. sp. fusiforme G11 TaxID=708437 RepID=A0A9P6TB74_9BASI|nr:hypothetical protein CROQUDRAFT_549298 [Cronartium quercuum f. sp. fusiforme G11]